MAKDVAGEKEKDTVEKERSASMESLSVFLRELSQYMVHHIAIMKHGKISLEVDIHDRIISKTKVSTENYLNI